MSRKKPSVVVPSQSSALEPLSVPIPQAAQMLGTSVKAVRRLLVWKELPHYKLGKRYLIPVESLRSYVRKAAA